MIRNRVGETIGVCLLSVMIPACVFSQEQQGNLWDRIVQGSATRKEIRNTSADSLINQLYMYAYRDTPQDSLDNRTKALGLVLLQLAVQSKSQAESFRIVQAETTQIHAQFQESGKINMQAEDKNRQLEESVKRLEEKIKQLEIKVSSPQAQGGQAPVVVLVGIRDDDDDFVTFMGKYQNAVQAIKDDKSLTLSQKMDKISGERVVWAEKLLKKSKSRVGKLYSGDSVNPDEMDKLFSACGRVRQ